MDQNVSLKMTHTPGIPGGVAYLYLTEIGPGEAAKQVVIPAVGTDGVERGTIILDFSRDGKLIGIEALEASLVLPHSLLANFQTES